MIRLASIAGALTLGSTLALAPTGFATPTDMLAAAEKVAEAAPRLSAIWPGYWPADQALVLYTPPEGAVLLSPTGARPDGFTPVSTPEGGSGSVAKTLFQRAGQLSDVKAPFRLDYPIGEGRTAVLVRGKRGAAVAAASLAFHERFHAFQRTAFQGQGASQFIDPAAIPDRAAFSAGADIERRILAAAISAQSNVKAKALLRRYFALRREREVTVPAAVARVEAGFESLEGSARWAELRATGLVFGGGDAAARRILVEQLSADLSKGDGPYLSTWFRGRSYAVGAALCEMLERFRPGWRREIEAGARLDALLATAVDFRPGPTAAAAAREGRIRYGFAQRLAELRPEIARVSGGEITTREQFYALAPYRVTFAYVPPRVNGRSAVTLGLASASMNQLTASLMVLPSPEVVSATLPFAALTVRKHPFLRDGSATREELTTLLPVAPTQAGGAALTLGEHRFPDLRLESEGYELVVRAPVQVIVTQSGMTVTALAGPSATAG